MVGKFQKEIVVSSISQKTAYLYDYLKKPYFIMLIRSC